MANALPTGGPHSPARARRPRMSLSAHAATAILIAPIGALLLQMAVGWSNRFFGLDPEIPAPGFTWAVLVALCGWTLQGLLLEGAEQVYERMRPTRTNAWLVSIVAAPLSFAILMLLYLLMLPATPTAAAAVSLATHLQILTIQLAFYLLNQLLRAWMLQRMGGDLD